MFFHARNVFKLLSVTFCLFASAAPFPMDYFSFLLGRMEAEYHDVARRPELFGDVRPVPGTNRDATFLRLKHYIPPICAGSFRILSINTLRALSDGVRVNQGPGTFSMLIGNQPWLQEAANRNLDIGSLQATNNGATFQAASNFNGLEGTSPNVMPDVSHYVYDNTQGPRAAISCFAATLLRKYGVYKQDGLPAAQWEQSLTNREVCFLDDVINKVAREQSLQVRVPNGYLDLSSFTLEQLERVDTFFNLEDIKVGIHTDAEVLYGYNWRGRVNGDVRVHQVYTAALDLGRASGSRNYLLVAQSAAMRSVAKKILNAAYEGTIRAAIWAGSRKVFLTMVGGGVFCNNLTWIDHAIRRNEQLIRDSGIEVVLVVYNVAAPCYHTDSGRTALQNLSDFSQHMSGTITRY